MLSTSCFSVTIASRFERVEGGYIEELKNKSNNESTKDITGCWKNVLKSGRMKET